SWRHIVRGDFNGDGLDDLFFYDQSGYSQFYRVNGSSQITALGPAVMARPDGAQIVPIQLDGTGPMGLYFYYPPPTTGSGLETFYSTDGAGGLTQIRAFSGLSSNWHVIAAGNLTSRAGSEILFYRRTLVDSSGTVTPGAFALYGTSSSGARTLIASS